MKKPYKHYASFVLLLVVFFGLATQWLNKPFLGHHDWDNVLYANRVHNYQIHGITRYNGMQVWSNPVADPVIYRNNPPTLPLFQTLFVEYLGDYEAFIRLPNIFITLVGICVFYLLGLNLYGRRIAFFAAFFFSFSIFVIYFARTVNREAGNTALACAMLLVYLKWLRSHRPRYFWIACALAFLGPWYGHFMAFMLMGLFVYSLIFGTAQEKRQTFLLGCVGLLGLASWLFYTSDFMSQEGIDAMVDSFVLRTSASSYDQVSDESFTIFQYFGIMLIRFCYGASPFLLILAVYGGYQLYRQGARREDYLPLVLVLCAFTWALC